MNRALLVLAAMLASAGPGLAAVDLHYEAANSSSGTTLPDLAVPHPLGSIAAVSEPLPGPDLRWSPEGLAVQGGPSPGQLVVPNVLNAGEQRVDDHHIYPLRLGDVALDAGSDLATADAMYASAAENVAPAPAPGLALARAEVPGLMVGLSVAKREFHACTPCLPSAPSLPSHAPAASVEPAAGAPGSPLASSAYAAVPEILPLASAEPAQLPAERAPALQAQAAGPAPQPLALPEGAALGAGLLLLGVLALGPLLLYSKIRRDATLDNGTRRQVFDAVVAEPGLSIQAVARRADISHSTAAYHLERLASAGLVVATDDGNKVRYYRNGGRFTEVERRLLPCLENAETVRVLEMVLRNPWSYRAEIAQSLGVTATTVNWHLKRLFAAGVLTEAREGRNAYLFVQRGALGQACTGLQAKIGAVSAARDAAGRLLGMAVPRPAPAAAAAPPQAATVLLQAPHGPAPSA